MTGIVLELQRDAMDSGVMLADLLRKAKVVAAKLDLRDALVWIDSETKGYQSGPLPPHRFVHGVLQARNPFHGYVPVELPEREMREAAERVGLRQPLAELEALASTNASQGLRMDRSDLTSLLGADLPLSIRLTTAMIRGVLDNIRDRVLEWALQLERDGVLGEGLKFTPKEKAAAAASTTIFLGAVGNAAVNSPGSTMHHHAASHLDLTRLTQQLEALRSAVEQSDMPTAEKAQALSVVDVAAGEAKEPEPRMKKVASAITLVKDSAEGAIAVTSIATSILSWLQQLIP